MATSTFENVTYSYFGDYTRNTSFCQPWQYFIGSLDCYLQRWWAHHWSSSNYLTVPALELVVRYVGRCIASSQPYWWWCGNYQDSDIVQLSLLSDNDQYTTLGLVSHIVLIPRCYISFTVQPSWNLWCCQTRCTIKSFVHHTLSTASVPFPSLTIRTAHKTWC
jgi:hypothetical protein